MKTSNYMGIFAIAMVSIFGAAIITAQTVSAEEIQPSAEVSNDASAVILPNNTASNEPAAILPSQEVSNNDQSASVLPQGQGANQDDSGSILPNTQGSNDDASGSLVLPVTDGSNYDESFVAPEPVTPVNPPSGGGSSSGSFSSGGSSIYIPQIVAVNVSTSTCPLITTFIAAGRNNDASEVAKLQAFLKNSQGLNVTVNGTYDEQTQNAVSQFQAKYVSDVMGPWGVKSPTGNVYITTKNKVNEISCNQSFALTAEDLAAISAYRARTATNGSDVTTENGQVVGPALETGSETTSTTSDEVGINDVSSQTAAAANSSILGRFWNFVVGLFK